MTGALNPSVTGPQTADAPDAKTAAACLTLASEIETLNKHGIAEKVSKAAAKKYKMKAADLAKAAELNKANAEFQSRCSNYPPPANVAETEPAQAEPPKKTAAKAPPPIPAPKPVVAAAASTPAPETAAATTAPATSAPATTGSTTATGPSTIMTTTSMPTSAAVTTANEGSGQPPPQP
jgi:hypothetical protein